MSLTKATSLYDFTREELAKLIWVLEEHKRDLDETLAKFRRCNVSWAPLLETEIKDIDRLAAKVAGIYDRMTQEKL